MTPRAVGAIALYPANNGQGGWYFLYLRSGKRVLCNQWDNAVIFQKVIDRVHSLEDSKKYDIQYKNDDLFDTVIPALLMKGIAKRTSQGGYVASFKFGE